MAQGGSILFDVFHALHSTPDQVSVLSTYTQAGWKKNSAHSVAKKKSSGAFGIQLSANVSRNTCVKFLREGSGSLSDLDLASPSRLKYKYQGSWWCEMRSVSCFLLGAIDFFPMPFPNTTGRGREHTLEQARHAVCCLHTGECVQF